MANANPSHRPNLAYGDDKLVTLIELTGMHAFVQDRFRAALSLQGACVYEALAQRFNSVSYRKLRPEIQALAADLSGLLDLDDQRLRFIAMRGATDAGGIDPLTAASMTGLQRQAEANSLRPRMSPGELVRRFAERGILVVAENGNLHVSPTHLLSDGDRDALRSNKVALLETLARPATEIL